MIFMDFSLSEQCSGCHNTITLFPSFWPNCSINNRNKIILLFASVTGINSRKSNYLLELQDPFNNCTSQCVNILSSILSVINVTRHISINIIL